MSDIQDIDETKYVDDTVYDIGMFYEMDPETEDLIRGDALREGMVVVLEDHMLRADIDNLRSRYDSERARAVNRWCTVTDIRRRDGYEESSIASFIAVYADGTKKERSYNESYCWIVKKDSLNPTPPKPDYVGLECSE